MNEAQTVQVQTQTQGAIGDDVVERAVDKVRAALRLAHEPVLFARIKLTMSADPAVPRPAIAQVNVDLNGRLIRVQATAETMNEAVDAMHDRLGTRLRRAARNWAAIRGRVPLEESHEWRHQSTRTPALPYFPRAEEERSVIRHKSYALTTQLPEEAVADMELLDYDFHLFTDRTTGEDSVVYRSGDGYRMARARPRPDASVDPAIGVSERPAPELSLEEAEARLEALALPFLFFVDASTGRGNLIYHRYDGHYGLITPADS